MVDRTSLWRRTARRNRDPAAPWSVNTVDFGGEALAPLREAAARPVRAALPTVLDPAEMIIRWAGERDRTDATADVKDAAGENVSDSHERPDSQGGR